MEIKITRSDELRSVQYPEREQGLHALRDIGSQPDARAADAPSRASTQYDNETPGTLEVLMHRYAEKSDNPTGRPTYQAWRYIDIIVGRQRFRS